MWNWGCGLLTLHKALELADNQREGAGETERDRERTKKNQPWAPKPGQGRQRVMESRTRI